MLEEHRKTLSKIVGEKPSSEDRAKIKFESPEQELFSRWVWGEITTEDYHTMNALLISQKIGLHGPVPLTRPPQPVREYVLDRYNEKRDNDETLRSKTTKWLVQYTDDVVENRKRLETLIWARSWLLISKNDADAQRITDFIPRFERLGWVDEDIVKKAEAVVRKDSIERSTR